MAKRLTIGLVAVAALSVVGGAVSGSQKPVRQTEFHIDGGPKPPTSVTDLWQQASVVVEATVSAARADDSLIPNTAPPRYSLYTNYEFTIHEVFKTDANVNRTTTTLVVRRSGGTRDRGDHIVKHVEKDFPAFEVGERYILFLQPMHRVHGGKYAVAGATGEGAYLIRNGELRARGKSEVAATNAANPFLFRETLRKLGGAKLTCPQFPPRPRPRVPQV